MARARRPWTAYGREYAIDMPGKTTCDSPLPNVSVLGPATDLRAMSPHVGHRRPNRAQMLRWFGERPPPCETGPRRDEGIRRDPNFKPYRKGAGLGRMCPSRVERAPARTEQPWSGIRGIAFQNVHLVAHVIGGNSAASLHGTGVGTRLPALG